MLKLKHELDFYDFIEEFKDELSFIEGRQGQAIIFDSLCDIMSDGDYSSMDVRDYLRFQLQEMDADYFISQYGHLLDLEEDADNDAKHEAIEQCLYHYTFYVGSYEHDGIVYYLFDEF